MTASHSRVGADLTPEAEPARSSAGVLPTLLKVVGVLVAVAALFFLGRELGAYVPRFAEWVDGLGFWGPVVFIGGYAAATVAFVPGSLLTLAAGAIFGLARGTLFVFFGSTLGASAAFLIARYLARGAVERRLEGKPRFASIDNAVAKQGRKIVFLMRLSPIFPFNLLNYALGLTKVRFVDYLIACVGMIPGTFLYVYYGKALGSLAAVAGGAQPNKGTADWVLLGVGLVATVLVTTVITRIAKKALSEVEEEEVEG
jgi:uncharacterized membrane protein YdjX (TVP38/TMEM64 family)